MEEVNGKIVDYRYIKGSSSIISGVKQRFAKNFEKSKNYVAGSCGTYRGKESAVFEVIVDINGKIENVDVKDFLKKNLEFTNFSEKRIKAIKDTKPEYHIELIRNSDNSYSIDKNGNNVRLWLDTLKARF